MMWRKIRIDGKKMEAAVVGGAILGGGGGGWMDEGRELGRLALEKGFSEVLPIQALSEDAVLLTVSSVGAPSVGKGFVGPDDYVRAVELFVQRSGIKVEGLISSEIGGMAVVNGWLQSAALNIPMIDAPCNGRAHPLGVMGSMGLHLDEEFVSSQTAVGGSREKGNRVEAFFEAPLLDASRLVRDAAVKAGGLVAVARNPVPVHVVKENGAPGAFAMALKIGKELLQSKRLGAANAVGKVLQGLGGKFLIMGRVTGLNLKTLGGLDLGEIQVKAGGRAYSLTFWNEYMTLESEGERIATFPDLMMTFDAKTSMPLISAQVKEGDEVLVISVPSRNLILGAGMRDMEILRLVEKAIGKDIVRFRR
jgi:DUF917 family protein